MNIGVLWDFPPVNGTAQGDRGYVDSLGQLIADIILFFTLDLANGIRVYPA